MVKPVPVVNGEDGEVKFEPNPDALHALLVGVLCRKNALCPRLSNAISFEAVVKALVIVKRVPQPELVNG